MLNMENLNEFRSNFASETRYLFDGIPVPRTTEILSKTIHDDRIVYWANSLGFKHKGYRKTLNEAASYGTHTHSAIENYLKHNILPDQPTIAFSSFLKWWSIINNGNTVTVLGQEERLSCPWFGGTYDMLIQINDKVYLTDFKTSNHLSFKYCLQLAAYNFMLKYNNRPPIDGFIILQLSKTTEDFNEMLLNMSKPEHASFMDFCEKTFLSLVTSFYYITETERLYTKIEEE